MALRSPARAGGDTPDSGAPGHAADSDVDTPVVYIPFGQEQAQSCQYQPFPELARLIALAGAVGYVGPDMHASARLDVAFIRIQQIDGKAALPFAVPADLVGAYPVGVAVGEIGPRAAAQFLGVA